MTAFERLVCRGRRPEVGERVRFLPELLYDAEGALGGREGEDRGD
ncbi:MAG: Fe-S cluster domain protein [Methanothrix sp.]